MKPKYIGILDPDGKELNPLTNEKYSDKYVELSNIWKKFPAYKDVENIIDTIKSHQVILCISNTGTGKTVLMPKYMLHVFDYKGKIAVTLPKQIIAKSSAEFASLTLDVKLGTYVGYQYKGSERDGQSENTKLLYATDGTIVARLLRDPTLSEFSGIVIDEAHERKIQIDFLLYLLKHTLKVRPDFKLLIMSATVNEKVFENYFTEFKYARIDLASKPNYPIKSIFVENELKRNEYIEKGVEIIKDILDSNKEGDILFFVTSVKETFDVCGRLNDYIDIFCVEVFAGMSKESQNLAQDKDLYKQTSDKKRKLIIATNVAESSLTIDGIKFVIDSGYELYNSYDPKINARTLEKKLITRAQAIQRMGRSGRTEPGICYHLYTEEQFDSMKNYPEPSIKTSNLYTECLRLLNLPVITDVDELKKVFNKFIDPPENIYINSAIRELEKLSLVENNKITQLGKHIANMQSDPCNSLALLAAYHLNCFDEVCFIVSCLDTIKMNINDLFFITEKNQNPIEKFSSRHGDIITILKIIEKYNDLDSDKRIKYAKDNNLKSNILDKINRHKRKLYRLIDDIKNIISITSDKNEQKDQKILACFMFGYRNNVAKYSNGKFNINNIHAKISKFSSLNSFGKIHSDLNYCELFSSYGRNEMTIISVITKTVSTIYDNLIKNISIN